MLLTEVPPSATLAHEYLLQVRSMLTANQVPRPHVFWIYGEALVNLMRIIGKTPYPQDGPIIHAKFYRYNLDTGRYRQVDPRPMGG